VSFDKTVSEYYTHGSLLEAIQESVFRLGKTIDSVTIEDLAAVDEIHIGGRLATNNLLDQLGFSEKDHIIDVGKALCAWVRLDKKINLHQGSALSMPFEDEVFDGAIMLHVGMNIENKVKLFKEIYRVLRPGAGIGVYDVMQINHGELIYPVPWATENSTSKLGTPDQYQQALNQAGFKVIKVNNRHDFALEIFKRARTKAGADGVPTALGLHTLMQESAAVKTRNMINNIKAGLVAPVEVIAQKP